MAKVISGSVGKGGKNDPKDVLIIRQLMSWHKQWVHPYVVKTTGKYDKTLEQVIVLFQKNACSLKNPDGRVDPNGFTLSRLNINRISKSKHRIFNICYNVNTAKLSDKDYKKAAALLNCEMEAIKAVAEVESSGNAWDVMGRPRILFERHYFRDATKKIYNKTHPDISGPYAPGSYGAFSAQYLKLYRAAVLNEEAALRSASWGKFQIMGENYKQAGYTSVNKYVEDMMVSEAKHLDAFANFIKSDKPLLDAIQKKNWARFAFYYNGSAYKKNKYDVKMANEYNKLKAQSKKNKSSSPVGTP